VRLEKKIFKKKRDINHGKKHFRASKRGREINGGEENPRVFEKF
jgi:hypothetical protein